SMRFLPSYCSVRAEHILGYCCGDFHGVRRDFMLPEFQYVPSSRFQGVLDHFPSLSISLKLPAPVFHVALGLPIARPAAVPKTSVYEDGNLRPAVGDVWSACNFTVVHFVPLAHGPE